MDMTEEDIQKSKIEQLAQRFKKIFSIRNPDIEQLTSEMTELIKRIASEKRKVKYDPSSGSSFLSPFRDLFKLPLISFMRN